MSLALIPISIPASPSPVLELASWVEETSLIFLQNTTIFPLWFSIGSTDATIGQPSILIPAGQPLTIEVVIQGRITIISDGGIANVGLLISKRNI